MTRNINFLEGWSWFKFNNLRLSLGIACKFFTSIKKWLKLKFRKFWGLILTFAEVAEEKEMEFSWKWLTSYSPKVGNLISGGWGRVLIRVGRGKCLENFFDKSKWGRMLIRDPRVVWGCLVLKFITFVAEFFWDSVLIKI